MMLNVARKWKNKIELIFCIQVEIISSIILNKYSDLRGAFVNESGRIKRTYRYR